jgi:TonB family protein
MTVMATGTDVHRPSRRPMASCVLSLGLHGVLAVLAVAFLGARVVPEPRRTELTSIEIVDPPPVPAAPRGQGPKLAGPSGSQGMLGRRGHDAPRAQVRAAAIPDPLAEVTVSYEAPTSLEPGNPAGTTGTTSGAGLLGDGLGAGIRGSGDGVGNLRIPPPPPPTKSLARPPRAKHPYRTWEHYSAARFGDSTILLELTIDPTGTVRRVRVIHGVDEEVDKRAIATVRHFEFYPALSPTGDPTWGLHRWEFELVSRENRGFDFN